MEQLDYLWDYQKLDLKIDELESKRKNSAARKELYRSIQYLKKQQQGLVKLNSDFDKKNHIYKRIYHEFESLNKNLKKEEDILNSGDVKSFKELDQIEQRVCEAQEKLEEKKKEINALLKDIESLNKRLQAISRRLKNGKKEYEENKKKYDLEVENLDSKQSQIEAQKNAIKGKLDDSLLKRYEAVKGNHSMAMAEIEQNRCGGCNMALASLVIQNVRDKSILMECENCGRILYSRDGTSAG